MQLLYQVCISKA
nr:unnamed protein product [Callosobruchus chinensis]